MKNLLQKAHRISLIALIAAAIFAYTAPPIAAFDTQSHSDVNSTESNPNFYADALYSLGLLHGTGDGYDLDRALTREEGVTMIVRLAGKESAALSEHFSHPFTDVADWFSPYLGYAYQSGIAHGTSDTFFGFGEPLTEASFLTFVLRFLGYQDQEGDFSWDKPEFLASELGIMPTHKTSYFSRAQMVEVCFKVLQASKKGSDVTIASQLIADKVFSEAQYKDAQKYAESGFGDKGFFDIYKITVHDDGSADGYLNYHYSPPSSSNQNEVQNNTGTTAPNS